MMAIPSVLLTRATGDDSAFATAGTKTLTHTAIASRREVDPECQELLMATAVRAPSSPGPAAERYFVGAGATVPPWLLQSAALVIEMP